MKRNNNNPPEGEPASKRHKPVTYNEVGSNVAQMAMAGVAPAVSFKNAIKQFNNEYYTRLLSDEYLHAAHPDYLRNYYFLQYVDSLQEYLESNLSLGLTIDDLKPNTIRYLRSRINEKEPIDIDDMMSRLESDLMAKIYNNRRYSESGGDIMLSHDAKLYFMVREPAFSFGLGAENIIPKNNETLKGIENKVNKEIPLRSKAREVQKAFTLLWGRSVQAEEVWKYFASKSDAYRERKAVLEDLQTMDTDQ